MDGMVFFKLWERKRRTYDEVQPGTTVHWYETRKQWIRWKTKLSQVEAFPYRMAHPDGVDLPKPDGISFARLGWERGDRPEIAAWLGRCATLSSIVPRHALRRIFGGGGGCAAARTVDVRPEVRCCASFSRSESRLSGRRPCSGAT
jgi:hypothetical protein